ncbi:MAG: AtpZ/AtpI family protein [Syntrophales bacterium]|nr:AtpZ/AtpI family protein [Syntrophales bacterium]
MDKETKKTAIQMAYASSIGISMVIAIFGCLFLGVWLDRKLGTDPYLTLLFLLIGIVAGFRNMYLLIKRSFKDKQPVTKGVASEANRKRPPTEKA